MYSSESEAGSDVEETPKSLEKAVASLGFMFDESSLIYAATRSRVPFDRPTEHEIAFFPELWVSRASIDIYIVVRNTTLATWMTNQLKECTALDVKKNLRSPYNADIELIGSVVNYLTRYGLINFGRFARVNRICKYLPQTYRMVVVIGAGAAGIAAATQLMSFGFDVIVVEARNRVGGRCQNFYSHGEILELGGDILRNCESSPLTTLMHQVSVSQHRIFDNTPIYQDGKELPTNRDQLMEKMYTNVRGALAYLAHNKEYHETTGLFVSRQQAYENVFNMIERHSLMNYYNYCKATQEICSKREHHYKKMDFYRKTALMSEKMLNDMVDRSDVLLRRSLKRDLQDALSKFDDELAAFELCDQHFIQHKNSPCCKQYMHPKDYRTYNFLLGFEEFLFGAQLEKVQFTPEAYKNKEQESVMRLENGCADLLEQVAQKKQLDVRLNHRVRNINWSAPDHITVTIERDEEEFLELHPTFVVSTLPIGVLKKTVEEDPRAPTFTPCLPEKKAQAIRNMGSALTNKVVLVFDDNFWDHQNKRSQFCVISPHVSTRASMLVWSSVPESKVMSTYLIGPQELHDLPDEVLVENAMNILKKIFPNCPSEPVASKCTRWHLDEFAFGSGSYMGLRTERKTFDDLMEPLKTSDGKSRVYFAGEHTSSNHANTLDGAWLSGLRVAADIANEHVGVGFKEIPDFPLAVTPTSAVPRTHRVDFDEDGRRLNLEK